ncbi:MAG: hypothetical protein Q8P90_02595 [bacterium]|nr:hypothetical protein [bacterium]
MSIIGSLEESYDLKLNERTGFDASTTTNLDEQTTADNVTVNPDAFISATYTAGIDYGIEFEFNDLTDYQKITVEDVWGNTAVLTKASMASVFLPVNGSTDIAVTTDLVITFNQYVYSGEKISGAKLRKKSNVNVKFKTYDYYTEKKKRNEVMALIKTNHKKYILVSLTLNTNTGLLKKRSTKKLLLNKARKKFSNFKLRKKNKNIKVQYKKSVKAKYRVGKKTAVLVSVE